MEQMPIEILKRDHRKVMDLLTDFRNEGEFDDKKRIAEKIFKNFEIHAKVEEEIFYPEVRNISPEGATMIDQSITEHNLVRGHIDELRNSDKSLVEYENRIDEIQRAIEDHVSKEESVVFPFAENNIKDRLGAGMSAKIMAKKAREMI